MDVVPYDGDSQRRWEEIKRARDKAEGRQAELKSTASAQLDARPAVARLREGAWEGGPPLAAAVARGGSVNTSLRVPVAPGVTVGATGQVATRRAVARVGGGRQVALDVGQAAFTGTLDWAAGADTHVQLSGTLGSSGPGAAVWFSRNVTPYDQLAVQMQLQGTPHGPVPVLALHAHRTFSSAPAQNAGMLSWTVGPESGLSLSLTHKRPGRGGAYARAASAKLELGVQAAALTLAASRAVAWGSFGGRAKGSLAGPRGLGLPELEASVTRKLGDGRSASSSVSWTSGAIVGKTAYHHQGHRFEAPVVWHGSPWASDPEEAAVATLAAAAGPLLSVAAYHLAWRPARWLWRRARGALFASGARDAAEAARARAQGVASLIRKAALARVRAAMGAGGVVVVRGAYGVPGDPSRLLDVTAALQWQCAGDAADPRRAGLRLPAGTFAHAFGFADPSPPELGRDKTLAVVYFAGGVPHRVEVADAAPLEIPRPAHQLGRGDPAYAEALEMYAALAAAAEADGGGQGA